MKKGTETKGRTSLDKRRIRIGAGGLIIVALLGGTILNQFGQQIRQRRLESELEQQGVGVLDVNKQAAIVTSSIDPSVAPPVSRVPAALEASQVSRSPNYTVVLSRAAMRIVVIVPKDRTVERLRVLCERLKTDFASLPIVTVMVFDNRIAAGMYDRMFASGGSLGESADNFYDQHIVANYSRNRYTGHNQYTYFPEGGHGRQIDSSC